MAGKKDNSVVAVLGNMTERQAAEMAKELLRAKNKIAPVGRGTIAYGKHEDVGRLLTKGQKTLELEVKK